jgi:glycosyltransferase involved in cell wall biosynthesis
MRDLMRPNPPPTPPTPAAPRLHAVRAAQARGPKRIGILNDYVRIPFANGSSFASQFFYREFTRRGHEVTIVGPSDPVAQPHEMPQRYVELPSVPFKNHPGVRLTLPTRASFEKLAAEKLDVALGQSNTHLLQAGVWLRHQHEVPFLPVHTVHLPSVYNVVLPDALMKNPVANRIFTDGLIPMIEQQSANVYNHSDGLIVLAEGLKKYWEARGVTAPIHVIPRPIEPKIFDVPQPNDPYPAHFAKGARLVVVCRHTREKSVSRMLEIFARHVVRAVPDATLTLVGDGPDHDHFRAEAEALGVMSRCHFPGEVALKNVPAFYAHGDIFLYTSLSETYGQVVSEALWCGLPVVAVSDGMGIDQQLVDGENGFLIPQGDDPLRADAHFGREVVGLLRDDDKRRSMGRRAAEIARHRSDPSRCIERFYDAFAASRAHLEATRGERSRTSYKKSVAMLSWTATHLAAAGLGLIRQPATVNRHGRKPPTWDELLDTATPAVPAVKTTSERVLRNVEATPAVAEQIATSIAAAQKVAAREVRLRARATPTVRTA